MAKFIGLEAVALGVICILLSAFLAAEVIGDWLKIHGWKVKSVWLKVVSWTALGFIVVCLVYAWSHAIAREAQEKTEAKKAVSPSSNWSSLAKGKW